MTMVLELYFATSNILVVKSTMFLHRYIRKYTWTSTDGKTHNQIGYMLKDRRWHSSILDVRSFRGADCDTGHYLLVAKVREKLAVSKHATQNLDGERFNVRKLNELEVMKEYQTEITKTFAVLEKLNDIEDVNRAWENTTENTRTSAKESLNLHELKQNKPWFDEECLGSLYQRKQAKIQWVQDLS